MSTINSKNVQVGTSGVAAQNFTLYQPATPDGTVRLGVGNSGATTADVITANSSGNVGIGTSSPAYKLDVNGNIYSGGDTIYVGNTSTYINYRVGNNDVIWSGSTGLFWRTDIANGTHSWFTGNTERARIDSSGNFLFNSGYGSVATAYGCRAWVNFNGTGTVAIRGSGNVSSITDNGTGNYTVNFATTMPDTNYAPVVSSSKNGGGASSSNSSWLSTGEIKAINSCLIEVYNLSSAYIDVGNIHFAVLR